MAKVNKIMLVDDDEASNFLSRVILDDIEAAREIEVAEDGDIACEMLDSKECPDIIFLDIRMPRMSGFDFLNSLVKKGSCKKSKIVLLTSSVRKEDRDKAMQYQNVIDYLEKPLTEEAAQKLIGEYFPS
jgi:CheY-like chemotaxis protein